MSARERIRLRAKWSLTRVAIAAGVAVPDVILFEREPRSVRADLRERLRPIYEELDALAQRPA